MNREQIKFLETTYAGADTNAIFKYVMGVTCNSFDLGVTVLYLNSIRVELNRGTDEHHYFYFDEKGFFSIQDFESIEKANIADYAYELDTCNGEATIRLFKPHEQTPRYKVVEYTFTRRQKAVVTIAIPEDADIYEFEDDARDCLFGAEWEDDEYTDPDLDDAETLQENCTEDEAHEYEINELYERNKYEV